MSTPNWKESRTYCRSCKEWKDTIYHKKCPRGEHGSKVLIDIANFQEKCTKCNQTWPLENSVFYCKRCGSVQETRYVDSILALEFGDQIIHTDGNIVHILKRSGAIVVGQRSFPDISHGPSPSSSRSTSSSKSGCGQTVGCLVLIFIVIAGGLGIFQFITHSRGYTSSGYYSSDLVALAPGSALAGYTGADNTQYVNFISSDKHIHELSLHPGANWVNNDLTSLSKGFVAAPGSALTGYLGSDHSIHVNFISTNRHVHELYHSPRTNKWSDNDLTAFSKGTAPAPGSALIGYLGSDHSIHVNFISTNQHVHELYLLPGAQWTDNDLTALSRGIAPTVGSELTGYWGSDGSVHVNFFSRDKHVHELYFNPGGGWSDNDLTSLSKGVAAIASSALAGYWGSDGSVHVNFIAANHHVHELYFAPSASRWSDNDLTSLSGGTEPTTGSPLAGYWGSDSSVHVNFIGTDGHVHELSIHSGGNWSDNDLTSLSGGTTPVAKTTLAAYGGNDGSVHVSFIATDRHIHELYN